MILSCILLRKMDSVVVSGFGTAIGLGMPFGALATDATAKTNIAPKRATTRARDRGRRARLAKEMELLQPLPDRRVENAKRVRVRVNSGSLIVVERNLCDSRRLLTEPEIQELIDTFERQQDGESLLRNGRIFAVRNLFRSPRNRQIGPIRTGT
jgi:hypothetical protein